MIFKRWEPWNIPTLATLTIVLPGILSALLVPHLGVVQAIAATFGTFFVSLYTSIALYRLSPFHPLAKYPGPTLGKLSALYMAWLVGGGKRHLYLQSLHRKYGDVVRIGAPLPRHTGTER